MAHPDQVEPEGWIRALDRSNRRRTDDGTGWGDPGTEYVAP